MTIHKSLRANPDKASAGIQGVGGIGHLAGALFQKATNTRFQFIPYPVIQDLAAGQIDITFDSPSGSLSPVRSGNIKTYAIAAENRLAIAPNIPTAYEAGLTAFYVANWRGMWAPKGTPSDIIAQLNAAVGHALADAPVRARLTDLGYEILPREQQTSEALAALQKAEIEKWWPIIKAAG